MFLLVNVNEEKQNQIKAKSFHFLLRNLNDKHFKMNSEMTLRDRKKLIMVVSVVSFRGVLLSRNCIFLFTVSVIHHCFTALTDYFQPFPAGSLFSPPHCKDRPSADGVKCPVRAITLIEQKSDPSLTPVLRSHQANTTTISKLFSQS